MKEEGLDREPDRQTGRERERQTDRHTHKKKGRQSEIKVKWVERRKFG